MSGRCALNSGCSILLIIFALLISATSWGESGGGTGNTATDNQISAAPPVGPSVSSSNALVTASQPGEASLNAFGESNLLALLTATLQRDYVQDRGSLELSLTHPWNFEITNYTAHSPGQGTTSRGEPVQMNILELPTAGVTPSFIVRFQLATTNKTLGVWQTSVQAHVWREVWVAHSNLRRGDPISGADLVREKRDVLNIHAELATISENDPSLEFAESVPSGVPLLARMVRPRAVIHRDQMTDALVQDGALTITMKVQVLDDGAPGQLVRARNPVSQRYLSGRVLDAHTIRILL